MKSDAELQRAVSDELAWDCRVDGCEIGVHVRAGVVTLTGKADSWAKCVAAQQAAHRVSGVLDVANEVQVDLKSAGVRTDAEIAAAVRQALEWSVLVPHASIRSTVSSGCVVLEGEVSYLAQRDDAERAIEHLAGVRLVSNHIVIKPPAPVRASQVRQAIHDALERRADRESSRILVDAHDGTVTLSGTCRSWGDKAAVVGAARGTAGVCSVRDELRIQP
jgi:osmotically-inducible protein OsmY